MLRSGLPESASSIWLPHDPEPDELNSLIFGDWTVFVPSLDLYAIMPSSRDRVAGSAATYQFLASVNVDTPLSISSFPSAYRYGNSIGMEYVYDTDVFESTSSLVHVIVLMPSASVTVPSVTRSKTAGTCSLICIGCAPTCDSMFTVTPNEFGFVIGSTLLCAVLVIS